MIRNGYFLFLFTFSLSLVNCTSKAEENDQIKDFSDSLKGNSSKNGAALAYSKYQKCGEKAAKKLLVSGF